MKENDLPVRLNITYITERIIAMIFPSEAQETTYKSSLAEISQVLKNKHEDNYLMVNLSERRNDMHKLHKQVIDFGWPESLAPPLERLCNICKSIDSWLNRGSKNVVVIHCKGGLGRLAVVLSAYIDYNSICANEDQSLDQLSMKQFFESKLNGVIQPSQKRYVHYFAGLLSGAITINNNSLFLHQIVIRGIPNFDGKGGCQPYIKIYQGMKPVYMSGVFSSSSSSNQIIVTLEPCLQLRSDVLVKCYNKSTSHLEDPSNREMIFRCQFHTCAINNNLLKFGKNDLDEAYQDARFPSHGQVEFVLSDSSLNWNKYECQPYEKNVLIGTSHESVQRWNSYENFAGLDEDVTFEDVGGYSTERREFFDQNHSSKTFNETKSSWKQNVDSSSFSKKLGTSDKWNVDGMERRFNDQPLDSGNVFNTTSNQSRLNALKSATSREMILDEQSHAFPATLPPQSTAEQQQLDDILKELLEEPSIRASSSNVLAYRYEHAPPSHGTITTESDKMRTTLSWQTSQAGSTKSATVNRQTLAEPMPHSKLASEVTRYREVTGDEDHIVGGKLTSVENYSCRMPGFQETRKVEMLSESKIDDGVFNGVDQRFVPIGDSYASLQRQRSLTDNKYRTYSGRNYASDSEDQFAWLESQRNKLRAKDSKSWKNRSMQEKQLLAELKSAQGAYYKTKKAQSDTEDFDHSYRRSDYSSDSKMLPLYIQEYRDSKGRRCQTIETETYSKRCETTTNQFAGSQSNTGNAITNVSQKQLMPPPRSSTPSTPVIPDRGESSREAFLRNQYALKPSDFDFDTRSHASLPRPNRVDPSQPVEVEIVSLQPIGPGVQTLESGMPGTGTMQRTPAITYPSQGTLNRDYNMPSSVSVPTSLSNLQPPSSHLKTSISQTQNLQQPGVAPLVPGYQHQTLQKSYMSDNVRTDGMQTLPPNFTAQPVVQTYKETQTWSTTNNQPSTLQQTTLQPNALQHLPPQMGGSVQHLNQQQTVQRTMTSSVDGRSVPILVERQDKPAVTHHPVTGSVMGQTLTRDLAQPQGYIQQQQQYIKQQQQQFIQQPVVARQEFSTGTMRSASSQNQLLVETHSPHLLGASAAGTRYRSLSSGGGGTFFTQQGTGTIRTRADSFSSAAGEAYEFINQTPKFIRDTSKMWHRPNFTREDATQYLKDKPPGSFVIRNSTTYPGSYGLTLRVAQVPSNVPLSGGDPQLDLVRHFIIEPTAKGVQLKGSANEPPFASLAAFVYQHSITPLSLPCKLLIPELVDGFESSESGSPQVSPSAACNVLYIGSLDTESLTGPEALSRALDKIFNGGSGLPKTQEVSFKASAQGITITDNKRRMFFRRHYPLNSITYLGLDNQEQKWAVADFDGQPITSGRVFGFVARKQGNATDNSCFLFAELDASKQSAQTLINFITHIMVDQGRTVTTTST